MIRPHAEMNVTPLIDVLLVLLVIFLAAVAVTDKGLDANLPAETRAPTAAADPGKIFLEFGPDRRLSINSVEIPQGDLAQRLQSLYAGRRDKTLYLAGAGSLPYGAIIEVMDVAKGAGVDRLGIVTEGMRRR